MKIQYDQAQIVRDKNPENLKSLDYTQYIPYEYRTLDRMALLLTGGDVCNAVCITPQTNKLIVAHNIPQGQTNEQAIYEENIKIQLLKRFKEIANRREKNTLITPLQYNGYLEYVIELAKKQDFLAHKRKNENEKEPESWNNYQCKDKRYIRYAGKVMHSLCYGNDPVTLNLLKSLRSIKTGEEKNVIVAAQGKHAEMNIVDTITGGAKPITVYIGISKLCCNDCMEKIVKKNKDEKNLTRIVVKGSHFHDRDHNQNLYPVQNKEEAEYSDQDNRQNQALLSKCELKMWLFQQDLLESKRQQIQLLQQQQQQNNELRTELDNQVTSLQKAQQALRIMNVQWDEQISTYRSEFIEKMSAQCKNIIGQSIQQLKKVPEKLLTDNDKTLLAQYVYLLLQDDVRNLLSEEHQQMLLTIQQSFPVKGQVLTIPPVPSQQTIGPYTQGINESDDQSKSKAILYSALCPLEEQILKLRKIDKRTKQLQEVKQGQVPQQNKNANLRRWGKEEGEGEMMKELVEVNAGKGTVLEEMRRKVSGEVKVEGKQDGAKKSGHVELLREVHDEHGASVGKLVERMEKMSEEEGKRSVVALERKEGGEHLGMRDVRLLAEVLRYNEGKKDAERIALPAGVEGTALWWDTKLVSEAQKHGVQVVGVEGKSLAHGQQSPEYNADREDYMAQKLQQLQRQGYNVVMPVGEAHVKGLQARLNANAAMETMRGMIQQNNAPLGPDNKGPHIPQHTATTKQVYGKFTAQLAHGNPNNHSVM